MDDQPDSRAFFLSFREPKAIRDAEKAVPIPLTVNDKNFYMDHKNRGFALIFNHVNFDKPDIRKDNASSEDINDLCNVLRELGFNVRLYTDLDFKNIMKTVEKASFEDHSTNDCLLVIVLSVSGNGIIYAKDIGYPPDYIWKPFTKCKTLIGKPKLFILQACPRPIFIRVRRTETDSVPKTYTIPHMADIMILRSNFLETLFVRSFNIVFSQFDEEQHHLLMLLTFLNDRLHNMYSLNKDLFDKYVSNNCIMQSSLTRLLYFNNKSSIE